LSTSTIPTIDSAELSKRISRFQEVNEDIVRQVRKVIVGQEEVLEQVMIALFVGGHCLITGNARHGENLAGPHDGANARARVPAHSVHARPHASDITGTDIIEEDPTSGRKTWTFVPGPIFANVLLADEIKPHASQDAVGAARSHAGALLHGARPHL